MAKTIMPRQCAACAHINHLDAEEQPVMIIFESGYAWQPGEVRGYVTCPNCGHTWELEDDVNMANVMGRN